MDKRNETTEINAEMLTALRAFADQWTKLSAFPNLVNPYSGAIVAARAVIAKADAELACRISERYTK